MKFVVAFVLSMTVLGWSCRIVAGYVADRVAHYGGPTPMALDTGVCFGLVAIVLMILSKYRIQDRDE